MGSRGVPFCCRRKPINPDKIDFQFTLDDFQNEMEYNCKKQSQKWFIRIDNMVRAIFERIYEDAKHLNNSEKIYTN